MPRLRSHTGIFELFLRNNLQSLLMHLLYCPIDLMHIDIIQLFTIFIGQQSRRLINWLVLLRFELFHQRHLNIAAVHLELTVGDSCADDHTRLVGVFWSMLLVVASLVGKGHC